LKRNIYNLLEKRILDFNIAREHLAKAQELQRKYYNQITMLKHFDVGDKVLLLAKNIYT
jgi:hypothetical protein